MVDGVLEGDAITGRMCGRRMMAGRNDMERVILDDFTGWWIAVQAGSYAVVRGDM